MFTTITGDTLRPPPSITSYTEEKRLDEVFDLTFVVEVSMAGSGSRSRCRSHRVVHPGEPVEHLI
ncbi:hypothetical protein HanIR_Chr02g0087461 [Helianthus annuus]|nr:hypothetical protein HanIR_Chr02g0087461 [Helianthus annuus]